MDVVGACACVFVGRVSGAVGAVVERSLLLEPELLDAPSPLAAMMLITVIRAITALNSVGARF